MPYDDTPANQSPRHTLGVIVKGYPRLSETFIAQEIKALEERGLRLRIYSLRQPYDPTSHPIHAEIAAPVTYLPEYLHREPRRVLRGWQSVRRRPTHAEAWRLFRQDLRRDRTPNRVRRFGQACVLAREIAPDVGALYAHFLHTPASVARYASVICGLPFAVSAHAKDIWTTPDWDIREKGQAAAWITTCTQAGSDRLSELVPDGTKVRLARHGIDLGRFPAPAHQRQPRNGTDPDNPVLILSVGRLVEKKGYADLLTALGRLPPDLHWRFAHIGGGEHRGRLARLARNMRLETKVEWLGAQPQTTVLEWLRKADMFALASRIATSGDRDGLPNVLVEAQSQALPCIATNVSGIPELIQTQSTGILVPPGDIEALSSALQRLIRTPADRTRIGTAGQQRVRAHFAMSDGANHLAGWLSDLLEPSVAAV